MAVNVACVVGLEVLDPFITFNADRSSAVATLFAAYIGAALFAKAAVVALVNFTEADTAVSADVLVINFKIAQLAAGAA